MLIWNSGILDAKLGEELEEHSGADGTKVLFNRFSFHTTQKHPHCHSSSTDVILQAKPDYSLCAHLQG